MNNSKYTKRAAAIHGKKFVDQSLKDDDIPMEQFWNQNVHNKEGVIAFYAKYYPALPEVLVQALANYFDRMLTGNVPLSDQFYRNSETNKKMQEKIWDYKQDIIDQKNEGLVNLTQCMQELLLQEADEEEAKQKKKRDDKKKKK